MSYTCLIIAAIFYVICKFNKTPVFTCDACPTARVLFWYLIISVFLKQVGITSTGGLIDSISGYALIAWYCAYNLSAILALYYWGDAHKRASMVVLTLFIELNIALALDFYGGGPYPLVSEFSIGGVTTHIYQALRLIFNLLLLLVFKNSILSLVKRGYLWLRGLLFSAHSHGSWPTS